MMSKIWERLAPSPSLEAAMFFLSSSHSRMAEVGGPEDTNKLISHPGMGDDIPESAPTHRLEETPHMLQNFNP